MKCLKDCCRTLMKRRTEQEVQVVSLKLPQLQAAPTDAGRVTADDYLLSKLPPDGREVPFVLPTFKASYIQPRGSPFPNLQAGPQSSARCTYVERKADLLASAQFIYSPESSFHQGHMTHFISPGLARRDTPRKPTSSPPGWSGGEQRLSSSMLDLSCSQGSLQHGESASSVLSSASSANGSSLDSISLSGDERELGKVCVRVSYQEAPEQVWITLVQCCELNLPLEAAEQPRIGLKGLLALPKALRFKSSLKDWSQDVSFMETFVFTLQLQQLRRGALVLRLQVHGSRKRTVAEGVLPLTQTGSEETEHWLRLSPLSKASVCRSELHLTICFQPVNGRIQLQVLAARHLPASSTPLSQTFFVKLELHHQEQVAVKKKTRALKALGGQCQWRETFHFLLSALDPVGSLSVRLYSRSSVRRKQCLGQIQLGCDSRVPAAAEQWRDAMANPEKVVAAWHKLSAA
ncbi:hypothetical protein fugu_017100 [Takifugu bimaculatus]|uniref:C2 domain-containing protein n=1 Tax=Takifugu bimaculatus TaxID=433685 RepID=A0A4Z2BVY3_9TELE|nr:hypothetical protein fugu_017100 [Takifugu bimaculatus]